MTHLQLEQGTLKTYVVGFFLSIVLTFLAYFATQEQWMSGWPLIVLLMTLGLFQAAIQLIFFLHLNSEAKPRWNLMTCLFMGLVVLIIVAGTLWIMHTLNVNVMPQMSV